MGKSRIKINRIPLSNCQLCGYELDSASDPTGKLKPQPGDLSICFRCQAIAKFNDELQVVPLTDGEMAELQASEDWPMVEQYRKQLKEFLQQ